MTKVVAGSYPAPYTKFRRLHMAAIVNAATFLGWRLFLKIKTTKP